MIAFALALTLAALLPATASAVTPEPAWTITSLSAPTHLAPGSSEADYYGIRITNTGAAPSDGSPITITDIPGSSRLHVIEEGWGPNYYFGVYDRFLEKPDSSCEEGPPAICTVSNTVVKPGEYLYMEVPLDVDAGPEETFTNQIEVSGGGASLAATSEETTISSEPAPFEFASSQFMLGDESGEAETRAGSHPYRMQVNFQVSTAEYEEIYKKNVRTIRNIHTALPKGVVVNPDAATARCTEAQLAFAECPTGSVVGQAWSTTELVDLEVHSGLDPLYDMVSPSEKPAELAFDPSGLGVSIHLLGGVDSAGEYALMTDVRELIQFGEPSGATVELWGDPSDPSHDFVRGNCEYEQSKVGGCPAETEDTEPFLTMPSACSGPLSADLEIEQWEEAGHPISTEIPTTDENGNPVGVTDCESLQFEPTLKARPTTNVADSPSGLEVDLHVPQEESFDTRAQSTLKDTTVALPEGLVINPAEANGLGACSAAQLGLTTPVGQESPVRTTAEPASCPDSAKLGTVEVDTPLLEDPLQGSVYIAKPYENPFNSLLALYIAVSDPERGVVLKLAGKVTPDPQTGRLTATFAEAPELPFEDFKLRFFGGAGGSLRTPATCGQYATTSSLAPWSAPQSGPPAQPGDSWSISQAPGGGSCPTQASAQPNSPALDAGTVTPIAGSYSPFVLNLHREDGSQEFSRISLTTPPGLTGKLAGIPYCSEAALKQAEQKSGREEEASPSCPAASQVGSVIAAAGAGPAPYYAKGTAYLTGPYEGAPLSLAIVTPATAGPFDLGTIVVRTALRLDPATGQISAVSDPIPHILHGIPLDVRSVQIHLDRAQFTRNGTSCDPLAISGSELSTLGGSASLSQRFQLAECQALGFKPKLAIGLTGPTHRGAHPALRAVLSLPEGGANLASASVALPHSEFLDQSHIGTVCTRVQFAAGPGDGAECPPASIYGHATAYSPLVDYAVEGSAILRSSNNKLPDLVLALHGPPSQPIAFEADARIDSVNGGIRSTFEATPDLPLSRVVLQMAGGRKGLLQNSTDICEGVHRATGSLIAQNAKTATLRPALRDSKCAKAGRRGHKKRHHRGAAR
jgi:hypothetical protein